MPIQRSLSARQEVILRNVAQGKTNKDIAAELGISEQGVKVHVSRLLERYGAENRVELVNITRAWPDAAGTALADLSSDIAGIRAGLNQTYQDATALGKSHGTNGNGHTVSALPLPTKGHAVVPSDLAAEVRSLRDVLTEINVAMKLLREMPPTAQVGPILDAIRARVGAALEQSTKLDALVDHQRGADGRPSQTLS
ncbi:MAG TPA: LuxR family transcriptional regulator [Candidatus Udaeobacter sp.]|nr:LuxR family transcriptional regulator [Candidatus Udaeobacter sp.]